MGSLGGGSSSSGCTGQFCTQYTSTCLQHCMLPCLLVVVWGQDLWEAVILVLDVQAHSVHSLQVSIYSTLQSYVYWQWYRMGSMGGGSYSSGCKGPFCTQSMSKYLQHYNPMFIGSCMATGSLGGGSSSSGCTGPFCTQSTSKYLQHCIILCLLVVVWGWDLWKAEIPVVDVQAHSVHSVQVSIYNNNILLLSNDDNESGIIQNNASTVLFMIFVFVLALWCPTHFVHMCNMTGVI